jgi:WD40 repeat protein
MAIHLGENITKLVYENIYIGRLLSIQDGIKNASLLETILNVTYHKINTFCLPKQITTLKDFNFKYARCVIDKLSNGNLIIGSNDGLLRIYDPKSHFTCIKEMSVCKEAISNILILKNGKTITRSWDKVIIWDNFETVGCKQLIHHETNILSVIQLDNEYIVSSGCDLTLILWDENTYINAKLINDLLSNLKLLSNDRFLGLSGKCIYMFDYDLNIISRYSHNTLTVPYVFESFDKRLVCCYVQRFIEIFDTDLLSLNKIQIPESCRTFEMLNRQNVVSCSRNSILVWNVRMGFNKEVYQYDLVFKRIFKFKNCLFLTTSDDKRCRLWNYKYKQLQLIGTFEGHGSELFYAMLIDKYLITASFDNVCRIYKIDN